jgi:ferric-dicitrate binding protein FerR (iron transport regulator)
VYFVAGALWMAGLLYVWLVLPESFPKSKREALRLERARQQSEQTARRWRALSRPATVLEPLKHLTPARHPRTGRRNWRLILCAVHMFFAGLGSGYAVPSLVTIITSLYQYTPAEVFYLSSFLPNFLYFTSG